MNSSTSSSAWKRALFVVLIFAIGAALAPGLFAQALEDNTGYSLGEKILGVPSGTFGVCVQSVLLLTSVGTFGWAIECFVNIRREKLAPPAVISTLQTYIDDGDLEGALQFCEANPGYLTRTIGAALNRVSYGPQSVKDAAHATFSVEQGKLEVHISFLGLFASTGTLQGLFGTVAGMVVSFAEIENAPGGQINPKAVAGGISLALLATCVGLVIAIPALCFYTFFKNRITNIGATTGLLVDDMVETIAEYSAQHQQQQG